jgi:dihydroneopterin aldolase
MHVPPYTIDDPIESPERAGVDVTIEFPAGKRWLFFITPDQLASAGDYAEATSVRVHLGEKHMIVVSELTPAVIDTVLKQLAAAGELEKRTVAYGEEAAA